MHIKLMEEKIYFNHHSNSKLPRRKIVGGRREVMFQVSIQAKLGGREGSLLGRRLNDGPALFIYLAFTYNFWESPLYAPNPLKKRFAISNNQTKH